MQPYIYLDHTSEAKFQAFGKDVEEAFKNTALAVFNLVVNTEKVHPRIKKTIEAEAKTPLSLLFEFVDQLVFIQDEGFMLHKVIELKIDNLKLKATLTGDDHKNYETHGEVKAPTYNDMKIELLEDKNIYMIQMVVDV